MLAALRRHLSVPLPHKCEWLCPAGGTSYQQLEVAYWCPIAKLLPGFDPITASLKLSTSDSYIGPFVELAYCSVCRKRRLSLSALDRVLAAQLLSLEDLLPDSPRPDIQIAVDDASIVPLVSNETALHSPAINQHSVLDLIHLPTGALDHLRPRRTLSRREWQRFLAVRLTSAQARPMEPVLAPGSIAVIDRHYNSLAPIHPARPNIYAVDLNNVLVFRYVSYEANRLLLRPRSLDSRLEVLRLAPDEAPSSCIVGRLCLTIAEL